MSRLISAIPVVSSLLFLLPAASAPATAGELLRPVGAGISTVTRPALRAGRLATPSNVTAAVAAPSSATTAVDTGWIGEGYLRNARNRIMADALFGEARLCPQYDPGTLCTDVAPYCGDDCDNAPFCWPTCWPTSYGPAWSGGGQAPNYLLYCPDAVYANCHFSGPPYPTGTDASNVALPCEMTTSSTTAKCTCEVDSGPNYVNLAAIYNLGVYYETVAVCGDDGSNCVNMVTCPTGDEPGCGTGQIAPVCGYVANQNPDDPAVSLIPGADLISTYGLTMNDRYDTADSTSCTDQFVAGCMTAPCYYTDDTEQYAQCECPVTYQGSFDLSQGGVDCDIPPGYVWE